MPVKMSMALLEKQNAGISWIVKDSSLIIGHNARTKEELSDMILHGKWNEFIREIPVKRRFYTN